MKEERINTLTSKYKAGETSRQEELYLQKNSTKIENAQKDIFRYIQHHKKKAPRDFNEKQWQIFELKQKRRKIRRYSIISVAASVLIVVSLLLINTPQKEMDYLEKQALLEEALLMIENAEQDNQETVLYEDEMVIIYTIK
jgi:hypothetical protein